MTKYVPPASILGVSTSTLRQYVTAHGLGFIKTPGGQKRYDISDVMRAKGGEYKQHVSQTLTTTSLVPQRTLKLKVQSTSESLPKNKKTTLSDKSQASKNFTQATLSTETSAQDSTTNGKDLRGFWNTYKAEQSKQLWLPTKTDLLVLQPKSLNGSLVADSSFRAVITNAPN